MLIRDIIARMRHDGCGGRTGKVELLTGIEDASSRVVTSGVNLPESRRIEFADDAASACSLDPIEDAAVLGPIKAKPFGWPRKSRPALTGPARDGCEI
jgi:hypothetical protein